MVSNGTEGALIAGLMPTSAFVNATGLLNAVVTRERHVKIARLRP